MKSLPFTYIFLSAIVFTILGSSITYYFIKTYPDYCAIPVSLNTRNDSSDESFMVSTVTNAPKNSKTSGMYKTRTFDAITPAIGLSTRQIDEHMTLYKKYVDKRNEIANTLETVNKENLSKTYSPFRALKIAETYALNGQILHELYFDNIGTKKESIGTQTKDLIIHSFGSIDAFKKDFYACAQVARGWVLCAYSIDDGLLHNFVLEEHNSHVPVLALPILVLDVYEHAYFIDYGTKIVPYVELFWDHINWQVVEQRVLSLVQPFRKT